MGQIAIFRNKPHTLEKLPAKEKENKHLYEVNAKDILDSTTERRNLFADLRKYLSSSAFHDVGPVTAKRIVSYFGARTPKVIESSLHELLQVNGVGRIRMLAVKKGWAFQRDLVTRSAALAELESHQDGAE